MASPSVRGEPGETHERARRRIARVEVAITELAAGTGIEVSLVVPVDDARSAVRASGGWRREEGRGNRAGAHWVRTSSCGVDALVDVLSDALARRRPRSAAPLGGRLYVTASILSPCLVLPPALLALMSRHEVSLSVDFPWVTLALREAPLCALAAVRMVAVRATVGGQGGVDLSPQTVEETARSGESLLLWLAADRPVPRTW